jgi:catechol 2,3-dioxygenase-like lactoylglutathione lyase family enzyme
VSHSEPATTFGPPVPELPVADVERAQQHYRDALGFEVGWLYPGGDIGAVSRGSTAIFFRRRSAMPGNAFRQGPLNRAKSSVTPKNS